MSVTEMTHYFDLCRFHATLLAEAETLVKDPVAARRMAAERLTLLGMSTTPENIALTERVLLRETLRRVLRVVHDLDVQGETLVAERDALASLLPPLD